MPKLEKRRTSAPGDDLSPRSRIALQNRANPPCVRGVSPIGLGVYLLYSCNDTVSNELIWSAQRELRCWSERKVGRIDNIA